MSDQHSATSSGALDDIKCRIGDLDPPTELRTSVANHVAHLQTLADSLRRVGIDEVTIDQHVLDLFERYEAQLMQAMGARLSVSMQQRGSR